MHDRVGPDCLAHPALQRRQREEILAFDAKAFLDEIGVSGALTSQRSNGLASMLARIQADAKALPAS